MENQNPSGANPTPNESQPTNPAPAPTPVTPAPKKGLSTGAIIAIVVGLFVLLIGGAIALFAVPFFAALSAVETGNIDGTSVVDGGDSGSSSNTTTKGNCKFYECLTLLTNESTVSDATTAFGFEPETTTPSGASYDQYTWTFDEDHTISMTVNRSTNSTTTITLDEFDDDEIKRNGIDLTKANELSDAIHNNETVTYDDFKNTLGGDGVLVELGSWNKYTWRSTERDGYVSGSFASDGDCMFMSNIWF